MKNNRTQRLALLGLLTALALIASFIEMLIPIPIGIPGVKLGLANLIIVWALYTVRARDALLINLMRIFLVGFLFGNLSMILYSLSGALLSFFCMYLIKKSQLFSVMGVSVVGGIMHNVGQLLVAMVVLETKSLLYYGPVLLLAGVVTGLLIGVIAGEVLKRVRFRE
jgi:heptaprenyl diphosphate synthase